MITNSDMYFCQSRILVHIMKWKKKDELEISKQIYYHMYIHQEVWATFVNFFFMEDSLFILSLSLNSIWVVLQKSTTWIFFKSSILMKDNARHLVTQKSFWEFHHVVNNIVVWAGPRERVESSLAQPGHSRPNLVLLQSY